MKEVDTTRGNLIINEARRKRDRVRATHLFSIAVLVVMLALGLGPARGAQAAITVPKDGGQWCQKPASADAPASVNCTYGQGYWKNHPEAWPVTSLTLGGTTYSQSQLLDIFNTQPRGDATYILAHQLIAAKLNVAKGAGDSAVASTIADAGNWLSAHELGSKLSGFDRSTGTGYAQVLDNYNNGLVGPGHCDEAGDSDDDGDQDGNDDGDQDGSDTWGDPTPWDSSYVGFGSVIKDADGAYHFWYSGGTTAMHHGIGYATSADGIQWTKSISNPIFHINDGVSWWDNRTYTPHVLYDPDRFSGHGHGTLYKMWFTGDDGSNWALGYALLHPPASVGYTAGNGQVSGPGVTLDPFVVTVRDSCDDPIGGVPITYTITGFPVGGQGPSLSITSTTTLSNGQASSILTLGDEPGVYTVTAEASGLTGSLSGSPVIFNATAQESGGSGSTLYLPIVVNDYAF